MTRPWLLASGVSASALPAVMLGFINVFERVHRAAFKSARSHYIFCRLHNWQFWEVSVDTSVIDWHSHARWPGIWASCYADIGYADLPCKTSLASTVWQANGCQYTSPPIQSAHFFATT
jgi:hypothetical protein